MRVIEEKKFYYVLMEDRLDWFLTFLSGGPVEIDFCVKLSENEIDAIKYKKKSVQDLIRNLQSDHDNLIKRRIVPSLWP